MSFLHFSSFRISRESQESQCHFRCRVSLFNRESGEVKNSKNSELSFSKNTEFPRHPFSRGVPLGLWLVAVGLQRSCFCGFLISLEFVDNNYISLKALYIIYKKTYLDSALCKKRCKENSRNAVCLKSHQRCPYSDVETRRFES